MVRAGWSRELIPIQVHGLAMHGYGQPSHTATGQRTALYARAFSFCDGAGRRLLLCCLDLGYVTQAIRAAVVKSLSVEWGDTWSESSLLLTCTHTHSGPGGCAHEVLYNLVTPGFVEEHCTAIATASVRALLCAKAQEAEVNAAWVDAAFEQDVPVAWNRSLAAWRRNPEAYPCSDRNADQAIDRHMRVLKLMQEGRIAALVSVFGVHATCLGNSLHAYDADNKGYAAVTTETELGMAPTLYPPVAIFAQGTAGDVSPHYHGPGAWARRSAMTQAEEVAYARHNGLLQSRQALAMCAGAGFDLGDSFDSVLIYVDFSSVAVDPEFSGGVVAATARPAHGVSFFAGTPVDGRGIAPPLAFVLKILARAVKKRRLAQADAAVREFYASHGAKDIFMDTGAKEVLGQPIAWLKYLPGAGMLDPLVAQLKAQVERGAVEHSPMVPTVLPVQIWRMGRLAWIACPGEFTTIAGQRVLGAVRPVLAEAGMDQLVLITYANEYMGYVTTQEEYEEQAYEGGHTIFGQWTLAAFQTVLRRLARDFVRPVGERTMDYSLRPAPVPLEELNKRRVSLP